MMHGQRNVKFASSYPDLGILIQVPESATVYIYLPVGRMNLSKSFLTIRQQYSPAGFCIIHFTTLANTGWWKVLNYFEKNLQYLNQRFGTHEDDLPYYQLWMHEQIPWGERGIEFAYLCFKKHLAIRWAITTVSPASLKGFPVGPIPWKTEFVLNPWLLMRRVYVLRLYSGSFWC